MPGNLNDDQLAARLKRLRNGSLAVNLLIVALLVGMQFARRDGMPAGEPFDLVTFAFLAGALALAVFSVLARRALFSDERLTEHLNTPVAIERLATVARLGMRRVDPRRLAELRRFDEAELKLLEVLEFCASRVVWLQVLDYLIVVLGAAAADRIEQPLLALPFAAVAVLLNLLLVGVPEAIVTRARQRLGV
jgi:hypothetical protein